MLALIDQDANVLDTTLTEQPDALTARDANQRSLLHWAALRGRRAHVELLLDLLRKTANTDVIDAPDDTGTTPLICATLKGDATICGWLLEAGANVNARTEQGHSPLQYACSKGWADCFELFLGGGADLAVRDRRGDSALHRLAALGRVEMLRRVLVEAKTKAPTLVDGQNAEGDTALHIACQDGEATCALLLVEFGASVELENREKRTAVDLAAPALRRSLTERQSKPAV